MNERMTDKKRIERWISKLMNATKSEDAYIAKDVILNAFEDKDDRIEKQQATIERQWQPIETYSNELASSIEWDRILCFGKLPWTTRPVVFCAHAHPWNENWHVDATYTQPRDYPTLQFIRSDVVTHWMPLPEPPALADKPTEQQPEG